MSESRLIHLTSSDWCWLIIGVMFGIVLTLLFIYICTYLPTLTEIQRTGLAFTTFGAICGYVIGKFGTGVGE